MEKNNKNFSEIIIRTILIVVVAFTFGLFVGKNYGWKDLSPIENDILSKFHVSLEQAAVMPSDIELMSYFIMKHIDIPYMNDIEQYIYHKSVSYVCLRYGILDPCLFYAQGIVESALNPRAVGAAGEVGIHQLMETTAWEMVDTLKLGKDKIKTSDFKKVQINTYIAGAYLAFLIEKHGTIERALSAYNGRPPEPSEYSKKVLDLRNKILEEINVQKSDIAEQKYDNQTNNVESNE